MIGGNTVVAAVVAGRRRYLEILLPYLRAQREVIDRCDLWCNTTDREDVRYIRQVAAADPFFRVIEARIPIDGIRSVYHFFRACTDPETVYVGFDDDICWIAPDAVERLVAFRLENPAYPLVLANTINNSICSHIHQRLGCLPLDEGFCHYDAFAEAGWRSGPFARLAHESFLRAVAKGETDQYEFRAWMAWQYERISINCICWRGCDFAQFGGEVGVDDELWLTNVLPTKMGQPNAICGTALVSHFAYTPQRAWLEANTDLLRAYRVLANQPPLTMATGNEREALR